MLYICGIIFKISIFYEIAFEVGSILHQPLFLCSFFWYIGKSFYLCSRNGCTAFASATKTELKHFNVPTACNHRKTLKNNKLKPIGLSGIFTSETYKTKK